jgi:hypothetical protein
MLGKLLLVHVISSYVTFRKDRPGYERLTRFRKGLVRLLQVKPG